MSEPEVEALVEEPEEPVVLSPRTEALHAELEKLKERVHQHLEGR
ncbi:hypothetical protein [Streptomyces sp. SBT349]|nr:hypothetical protein [Streptomyces sp. SBT349]